MRTLVEKKKTDFINLGLKHIFPKGVQIFGGGKAYLSAGPSVLRNFNLGRDFPKSRVLGFFGTGLT